MGLSGLGAGQGRGWLGLGMVGLGAGWDWGWLGLGSGTVSRTAEVQYDTLRSAKASGPGATVACRYVGPLCGARGLSHRHRDTVTGDEFIAFQQTSAHTRVLESPI